MAHRLVPTVVGILGDISQCKSRENHALVLAVADGVVCIRGEPKKPAAKPFIETTHADLAGDSRLLRTMKEELLIGAISVLGLRCDGSPTALVEKEQWFVLNPLDGENLLTSRAGEEGCNPFEFFAA